MRDRGGVYVLVGKEEAIARQSRHLSTIAIAHARQNARVCSASLAVLRQSLAG